jgi:hypothetical protein
MSLVEVGFIILRTVHLSVGFALRAVAAIITVIIIVAAIIIIIILSVIRVHRRLRRSGLLHWSARVRIQGLIQLLEEDGQETEVEAIIMVPLLFSAEMKANKLVLGVVDGGT